MQHYRKSFIISRGFTEFMKPIKRGQWSTQT